MYNHKTASDEKFPLILNGKIMELPAQQIGELIKQKLRSNVAMQKLFNDFEVDGERLKELKITIEDLDDRYAETDLEHMALSPNLFEGGDFFEKNFFVVAHEIVHWLSRIKEEDAYFNDPEETLGFTSSIAYELEQGTDMDIIWNRIYPKIEFHFNDERDAKEFFRRMTIKAKRMLIN